MTYPNTVFVRKVTSTFGGHSRNTPQVTAYQVTSPGKNIHLRDAPAGYPHSEQEQRNIRAGRFHQPMIIAALSTKEEVVALFPHALERNEMGDIKDFATGRYLSVQELAERGLIAS